uniref:BPTI/Kunitz inhibitor domain-containing protein n=1 Tax=Glossina morsitans morsitans TaxID=37546 RepID=A0A1B0ESD6_GLOMM
MHFLTVAFSQGILLLLIQPLAVKQAEGLTVGLYGPDRYEGLPEVCLEPMDFGYCRAKVKRFYFDIRRMKCSMFYWGGCAGNDNNFKSIEECNKFCVSAYDDNNRISYDDNSNRASLSKSQPEQQPLAPRHQKQREKRPINKLSRTKYDFRETTSPRYNAYHINNNSNNNNRGGTIVKSTTPRLSVKTKTYFKENTTNFNNASNSNSSGSLLTASSRSYHQNNAAKDYDDSHNNNDDDNFGEEEDYDN